MYSELKPSVSQKQWYDLYDSENGGYYGNGSISVGLEITPSEEDELRWCFPLKQSKSKESP